MSSEATIARASAMHFEAKKTGFGQAQDGWSLTLRIQDVDIPAAVRDARKGTRYMVALVELNDDETPKVSAENVVARPDGGETPAAANGFSASPNKMGDVPTREGGRPAQQPEPKPKNYTGAAKSLACNPVFWEYLRCQHHLFVTVHHEATHAEKLIEQLCDVTSCADIKYGQPSGGAMAHLLADFYEWERLNQQGETR